MLKHTGDYQGYKEHKPMNTKTAILKPALLIFSALVELPKMSDVLAEINRGAD